MIYSLLTSLVSTSLLTLIMPLIFSLSLFWTCNEQLLCRCWQANHANTRCCRRWHLFVVSIVAAVAFNVTVAIYVITFLPGVCLDACWDFVLITAIAISTVVVFDTFVTLCVVIPPLYISFVINYVVTVSVVGTAICYRCWRCQRWHLYHVCRYQRFCRLNSYEHPLYWHWGSGCRCHSHFLGQRWIFCAFMVITDIFAVGIRTVVFQAVFVDINDAVVVFNSALVEVEIWRYPSERSFVWSFSHRASSKNFWGFWTEVSVISDNAQCNLPCQFVGFAQAVARFICGSMCALPQAYCRSLRPVFGCFTQVFSFLSFWT